MGQRNYRAVVSIIMSAMILFALSVTVWGQQVTGAIVGTVTDQSDAPIVGARVVVTDQDRGFTYNSLTNSEGAYNFPRMPIGNYTVKIEQQGFQAASQKDVVIEINRTARIDVKLQVGQITQVTEISSDAPLLQTESTQINTLIDSRTNIALPLATRNYVQLTLLSPGATNPNPGSLTSGKSSGNGAGRPYINGNREQSNNFLLDGLNNNQVSDNLVGYAPSQEAIQEFNLITSNASAEFGSYQGGIVSVSIKSGTNQFHGSAYEFLRNDALNANSWGNNLTGTPKGENKWNIFGGAFGGPIIKDKLFFFADYQGTRNYSPGSGTSRVFTDAMRKGDFSSISAFIKDPLKSGKCQPADPEKGTPADSTACFKNSFIDPSRFSPVVRKLFASPKYPSSATGLLPTYTTNSMIGDQGDIKLDYRPTDRNHFFVRYSQSALSNPRTSDFLLSAGNSFSDTPTQSTVFNWTRTISPSFVNEFRAGVNYVKVHDGGSDNGLGNFAEELGIKNANAVSPGLFGINLNSGGRVDNIGNTDNGTQELFANTVIQFEDSAIITKGKHVFHTGFQFQRFRLNQFYATNSGRSGIMNFTTGYTNDPLSDFVLGLPTTIGQGLQNGTWGQRSSQFGAYFQDDFRVNNSLTLNLGLRYETNTPWVEVNDRLINLEPFTGRILCAKDTPLPDGTTCKASSNRALYNSTNGKLGNFQPRIGFAWTPSSLHGKTVIRGGYSVSSYLEGTGTNLRLAMNPPLNKEKSAQYSTTNGALPGSTIADGFTTLKDTGFDSATLRVWDPNVRPAVAQQWNLTIQQQLTNSTTLQVGYVGQQGTHLMVPMPYNQKQWVNGKLIDSAYTGGNPLLKDISVISGTESNGRSKYHALQSQLQKRFSGGLQFNVAYTYSKTMTDSSGYYGSWGAQANPANAYWQNLYDRKAEWGRAYYDVAHMLTSYAIYELPIGKGKRFGSNLPKVANAIVGNWQVSPIITIRGGFPLTTYNWAGPSGTTSRGERASCNGPVKYEQKALGSGGLQWFDPSTFSSAPAGQFGTCGVGNIMGPGMKNIDLSLQKQFPISESKRLEFRGEFINFTNSPILNAPSTTFGGGMGVITSSQPGRNVQLALKFVF